MRKEFLGIGNNEVPKPIPSNLSNEVGEVIKAWRFFRGLRSIDLARLAGPPVTQPYLTQLEKGKVRIPGDEHVKSLSRALQISPGHILARIGPNESEFPSKAE